MKIFSKILAGSLIATSLFASDVMVYKTKEHPAVNFNTVSDSFKSLGYSVQAVSKLDKKFKKKFNDTTFDKFKIMAVYNRGIARKLILKYPDAGAFIPFSAVLQSYANSDDVTFTMLNVDTMKKVLDIKDEKLFDKLEEKNNKVMQRFGFDTTKPKSFDYSVAKAEGPLLYKKEISAKDAAAVAKKLTDIMKKHKFSVVSSTNLADTKKTKAAYDYYTTFSICKVKVLFQAAKTRPEAAAFAPCSLAIYKKKGSDKVVVAFPSTYNWLSSLNMQDPKAIKILKDEQKEIEHFINSL
jgi:uncharacterized protein (DUF302 family)